MDVSIHANTYLSKLSCLCYSNQIQSSPVYLYLPIFAWKLVRTIKQILHIHVQSCIHKYNVMCILYLCIYTCST